MIYTSLAVLALSASTALSPLSNLVHRHVRSVGLDKRISLILHNTSVNFQDIAIDGHSYTIPSHHEVLIKALVGTRILAASSTGQQHRGELIVEVSKGKEVERIELK